MSYVYINGISFVLKQALRVSICILSLFPPTLPPTTKGIVADSFVGLALLPLKPFLGLALHELLFMGLVSLLTSFAFWRHHLWPTIINTTFQKNTFGPENPQSFYSHWFFVFSVLRSVRQLSESLFACFDDGKVHDVLYSFLPYWVFPAFRKKIVPDFLYLVSNGT